VSQHAMASKSNLKPPRWQFQHRMEVMLYDLRVIIIFNKIFAVAIFCTPKVTDGELAAQNLMARYLFS
jgi:hypothetical protein